MDPFECRMRFTSLVTNLNATNTSAVKAAQYALKYKDMDEDLHMCIIEQLEKPNSTLNSRANILYFLEVLLDHSSSQHPPYSAYIRMLQRDILRIIDAVAPFDGSGAANIKVVRKVLTSLQTKGYLLKETVGEIDEILTEREGDASAAIGSSPPLTGSHDVEMKDVDSNASPAVNLSLGGRKAMQAQKLDKKQIEQRIEEDRERHKRLRESIWAIPAPATVSSSSGTAIINAEFDRLWDETSDLGEDDLDLYREESEERIRCAKEWREECETVEH